MRKLFLVVLIVVATFTAALAQNAGLQNMGRAPKVADGVGRVDARIVDTEGNPVRGAKVELKSKRTGGRLCEAWNWSNATGQAVLPPLHIGQQLRLTVEAPGFEKQSVAINASDLDKPVVIKLVRKS